jgi:hypothetical protein
VRREAEFAEGGFKERSPLAVVGLGQVENNRDMGANVDGLNDVSGRWRKVRLTVGGGRGRGRVSRGSHGRLGSRSKGVFQGGELGH